MRPTTRSRPVKPSSFTRRGIYRDGVRLRTNRRSSPAAGICTRTRIVLHAAFPIASKKFDEALEQIEDLVEHSQAEDGMLEYRATTDVTEPTVVRFFEH
ncbi:putative quinol monooxygenase [Natrialbaceae archaeon GCM10025810]|uniref:putative quinol monooxygenase n=1 Tax=Halovalidus salilacus TaxID=3075124 RepID=UPI0036089A55